MKIIIYKECPNKECQTIQGFYLDDQEIKENKTYSCCNCNQETKLNKMIESSTREYNKQNKLRKYSKFYK